MNGNGCILFQKSKVMNSLIAASHSNLKFTSLHEGTFMTRIVLNCRV